MTRKFEALGAKGTPAAELAFHFLPWVRSLGSLQPDPKHGTAGAGVGAVIRPWFWGVWHIWPEVRSGCRVLGGLRAELTLSFVSPAHPHWHDAQRGAGAAPEQRQSTATHQTPGEQWHSLAGARGHGLGSSGCSSRDMESSRDGSRDWNVVFPQCCLWEFPPTALGLWLAGAQGNVPVAWQKREEALWGL